MLNDKDLFKKNDPDGMHELLESFPSQLAEGRQLAHGADIGRIDTERVRNIVLCGMGGSAIGGDLIRAYGIDTLRVPFYINREYRLPAFVGANSLVIGSSYSGNTEETLSAFSEAEERGAQLMAVTTGGELGEKASRAGYPLVILPGGLPPRAALGYSFSPILTLLENLGFFLDQTEFFDETTRVLESGVKEYGLDEEWKINTPKKNATVLHNSLPIIYTDDWLFNAAGVRFRGQINENAKQLAYSAVLPENNHNELVGWNHLYALPGIISAVFFDDKELHPRVRFRMEFLKNKVEELACDTTVFQSRGESRLARTFSLIQLGDWTSYYLAMLNEEDPTPVEIIDTLKGALAEFEG